MKNVYYSIIRRSGLVSTSYNTTKMQSQFLFAELAEKECKKLNKEDSKYNYFVELSVDEIANEYNYKGFYIIKSNKGFYGVYYKVFRNEDGKRAYQFQTATLKRAKEMINNKLLSGILFDFAKGIKQYRCYSINNLICEKSFNAGNGSLALFKILPKGKKIKVNSSLATKRDLLYIEDFKKASRLEDFELTFVKYGYPEYYSHSF